MKVAILLLLLASPVLAAETALNMDGSLNVGCNQIPTWSAGEGYAQVVGGRCLVRVSGIDDIGGNWFGQDWHAAFDLTSSFCDSVTATFWYVDRGLTWRVVRLIPALTGRGAASYRSPVLPGLLYPGHLEITGYGRNVNFNVARARVEWRDGPVSKSGEEPSTWGALKGQWR